MGCQDFSKEVYQGLGFRFYGQLKKVGKWYFKGFSCWRFCHLMKGWRTVRSSWKVLEI